MENEEIRYTGNAEEYLLQIPVFTKEKHSLDTVREIFHRIGRISDGKSEFKLNCIRSEELLYLSLNEELRAEYIYAASDIKKRALSDLQIAL